MNIIEALLGIFSVSLAAWVYSLYVRYTGMQREVFKNKIESAEKGALNDASKMSDADLDRAIRDELSEITEPNFKKE